jgi:hypothetical protein
MEQHVADLRAVFQRLVYNGLAINLEKCEFAVPELDFLGHRLSPAASRRWLAVSRHSWPGTTFHSPTPSRICSDFWAR